MKFETRQHAQRKPVQESKYADEGQRPLHKVHGWMLDAFTPGSTTKTFTYFHAGRRERVIVVRSLDWVRG